MPSSGIIKILQELSYDSCNYVCSFEEKPTFQSVCNMYSVPYSNIFLGRTFECFLFILFILFILYIFCFVRQPFLFWETVTSSGMYWKFILATHTSTFYGNDLVSYLGSTNIYCRFHQTMTFCLFLNNLTEYNQ